MIKRLWNLLGKYKKLLIISTILVVVEIVFDLLIPVLMQEIIDTGIKGNGSVAYVVKCGVQMVLLALLALAAGASSGVLSSRASAGLSKQMRTAMFDKIQDYSFSNIDKFSVPGLVTRMTTDITNVQNFLSMLLRIGILAPMMAVAGLVFSSATGGKVSSVLAIAVPVLIAALSAIVVLASRYSVKLRRKLDRINRLFLESLECGSSGPSTSRRRSAAASGRPIGTTP